jgi:hypothetical protein
MTREESSVHPHSSIFVRGLAVGVAAAAICASACSDSTGRLPTDTAPVATRRAVLPSTALVTIPAGPASAAILPYLTDDLATERDPVNLVFSGQADPRAIRDALLGLDGTRGAPFPPVFPFTCTWSDAIGGLMAGYGEAAGWEGAATQLQCGTYGPIRFHLRLVKLGAFTIGNAHFELLIPGTTDHQVLSWELAEQLVTYDLARTGLLGAAPASTGAITAAPVHRTIPAVIYNGLPASLRLLIGGPPGDVTVDPGIANDGHATSFVLATLAGHSAPRTGQRFTIQFSQVIPKPFCARGPFDYLLVQGPVLLEQEVETLAGGELRQSFRADGELLAVPIDPFTGLPDGQAYKAMVSERQESRAADDGGSVSGMQHQQLLPSGLPGAGSLVIKLKVAPGKDPSFDRTESCK